MLKYLELVRRKSAQLASRAGIVKKTTGEIFDTGNLQRRNDQLVFRYYPYHFIEPESIRNTFLFDENNIPYRYFRDTKPYRNMLYPAYWGLVHANQHDGAQDRAHLKIMQTMCDYLLAHGENVQGRLHLTYTIDHPKVHVKAPWISGLTQSLASSLFLRTYILSGNVNYLAGANNCALALVLPIAEGGVLSKINDVHTWVEEYPGEIATHVLNGCLFGLIALTECALSGLAEFRPITERLAQSVISCYTQYRHGRYLFYDLLREQFCSPHYMGLHTMLFYHLWMSLGDRRFYQIACDLHEDTHWRLYMRSIGGRLGKDEKAWMNTHLKSPD